MNAHGNSRLGKSEAPTWFSTEDLSVIMGNGGP